MKKLQVKFALSFEGVVLAPAELNNYFIKKCDLILTIEKHYKIFSLLQMQLQLD